MEKSREKIKRNVTVIASAVLLLAAIHNIFISCPYTGMAYRGMWRLAGVNMESDMEEKWKNAAEQKESSKNEETAAPEIPKEVPKNNPAVPEEPKEHVHEWGKTVRTDWIETGDGKWKAENREIYRCACGEETVTGTGGGTDAGTEKE